MARRSTAVSCRAIATGKHGHMNSTHYASTASFSFDSCKFHHAAQAQPLLLPEAAAILASGPAHALAIDAGQLVAHARARIARREIRGAQQHIPNRQDHAEVATAHAALAFRFMPHADRVVRAVETGRDQQPLADAAEVYPHIRMLQA